MKQLDELELMLEKQRETIENQRRQVKKLQLGFAYKLELQYKLLFFSTEIRNLRLKKYFN